MNSELPQTTTSTATGPWGDPGRAARALRVRSRDRDRTIPLSELDAVIECPPVTPVPAAPVWLLGIAAYKGALLSVVDLAAACGEAPSEDRRPGERLLLVETGAHRVAFSVDAILSKALDSMPCGGSTVALRALAAGLLGTVPERGPTFVESITR